MPTTQDQELDAVKRKIRALIAKTEPDSGEPFHVAEMAMEKVGELLTVFNLTLDEVLAKQQVYLTKAVSYAKVLNEVATSISKFCDCKVWYTTKPHWNKTMQKEIKFFGMESDVDMALYLCHVIADSHKRAYQEFKDSAEYRNYPNHRKVLNANFTKGFASRMSIRLTELRAVRKENERKAQQFHAEQMKSRMLEMKEADQVRVAELTTGTALAIVPKEQILSKEFSKLGMKLRGTYQPSSGRYEGSSRSAGRSAADSVNLDRPIGGSKGPTGYLK
jgi:hypothetical protein